MCEHSSISKGLKCTDKGYCPICLHKELMKERKLVKYLLSLQYPNAAKFIIERKLKELRG